MMSPIRMRDVVTTVTLGTLAMATLATEPARADKIDRVVVFADRAEVTRVTTVKCEGGTAKAVFAELPEGVDLRTLRGDAEGDAVAVGVSTQQVELAESLDERVRTLQKEIADLEDARAALVRAGEDDAERARSVNSYGAYLRTLAREEMRQAKPDAARWDQTLDFLDAEAAALVSAAVVRAGELRILDRKSERANARLARLNPASAPSSLEAAVAVRCNGSATVKLSYVVPGATWNPEYDLRFAMGGKQKTGAGNATLTVAGVISQSSGEDWSDAEIWLSTSKPLLGGEAPLPNPIYVSGYEDETKKTLVQAQEQRADDLKTGTASGGKAARAELEDGGKAFILKLPRRVTVRADGRPYWFPVDDVSTKAKAALVALPALSPYVFQLASFNNPAPYPLMAGRVHVYRGPTFVGDVDIEYRAPGEPMEVSLGLDEEIELDRKDLQKQSREAGFLSGTQSIAHSYRTLLKNRSDGDVVVEIREQIPVSKMADIKVVIDGAKTAPGYTLDAVRGHLVWKTTLKQGATATRDIAFTIELPKDWALQ